MHFTLPYLKAPLDAWSRLTDAARRREEWELTQEIMMLPQIRNSAEARIAAQAVIRARRKDRNG